MAQLNKTHDSSRKSWIESANATDCDFPIQNLPVGMFSVNGGAVRPGMAIGDQILDLTAAQETGLLSGDAAAAAKAAMKGGALNHLMSCPDEQVSALRHAVFDLLESESSAKDAVAKCIVPMGEAEMHLPSNIGNFTDFLTSREHFRRFRDGPLALNFQSLPIAYHSRASSVRLAGDVHRPHVLTSDDNGNVQFKPTARMDYELEMGFFVSDGNPLGQPIRIGDAAGHIFGYCLLNDWSVRDAQSFESVPLGPFLAKSLSTTISPWVVTEEALRPFRAPVATRAADEARPLPHLNDPHDQQQGALDINLYAHLLTDKMRAEGTAAHLITHTNARVLYWSYAQMLTHHTSNGCNLLTGDLLGTGTISGTEDISRACLGEVTNRGADSFRLSNGEVRTWLEDGDEVIFTGRAARDGFVPIGFGEARGRLIAAV